MSTPIRVCRVALQSHIRGKRFVPAGVVLAALILFQTALFAACPANTTYSFETFAGNPPDVLNYPIKLNGQAAQTFTVPGPGTCRKLLGLTLYIIKDMGGSGTFGDVIVEIWTTAAGKPSAPVPGATSTIPAGTIGTNPASAAVPLIFSTPPSLIPGNLYAVVVRSPNTTNSYNYKLLGQDPGSPVDHYTAGRAWHQSVENPGVWGGNPWSDAKVEFCFGTCGEPPNGGCTLTQGYWKNHPEDWPVSSLMLGTVTYSQQQLLDILHQPVKGNGLISLAHQLIAAKLNIANGAGPAAIAPAIMAADALIGNRIVPPVGSGHLTTKQTSSLTSALDNYNNGVIGPGHCAE